MSESALVSVSRERDGVALIHLNRPPANSYNRAFLDDLNAAVDEVRWDDDLHGAVLVSDLAPRFFSAGADISEFEAARSEQGAVSQYDDLLDRVLHSIQDSLKPSVAMIHGFCMGGGLEVALACDLRYCGASAQFGIPEAMARFDADREVRCVAFRGAGSEAFSAGADISGFETARCEPAARHRARPSRPHLARSPRWRRE